MEKYSQTPVNKAESKFLYSNGKQNLMII